MKANFKYVMMMAAALVLGFSSCSNDNETSEPTDSAPKSVTIYVSNPSTYAEEESAVNKRPTIHDLNVYFIGAGVIKKTGTMASSDMAAGKTFDNVPGSATDVVIIGNAERLSSPAVSTIAANNPVSKLDALMFKQDKQTDPTTDVNVHGRAVITEVAGVETADITLAPAISRLEIAKVEAKAGADIELSSFKLAGIYINNTYTECGTDYTTLPTAPTSILNYDKDALVWTTDAASYPARFKDEWANPTASTSFTPTAAGATAWSYYIMPVVANKGTTIGGVVQTSVPHITLKITDAKATGYILPNPAYVTVKELQVESTSLTALEKGKVYSIATLAIGGENLAARPEVSATQDVIVKATVTAWSGEAVDPIIP